MEASPEQLQPVTKERLRSAANEMFESRGIVFQTFQSYRPEVLDGLVPPEATQPLEPNDWWGSYKGGELLARRSAGETDFSDIRVVSPLIKHEQDFRIHWRSVSDNVYATINGYNYPVPFKLEVVEQYLDGNLSVNGRTITLDPNERYLKARVTYLLTDASRVDLVVTHTSAAYSDKVTSNSEVIFGQNWGGVPSQPFSDHQMDASRYLERAFEMLTVKTD